MSKRIAILGLTFALLALSPALLAETSGGGSTCYNCDNWSGSWECKSGSVFGGTSCTVNQDSCTVSGDCGSSSGIHQVAIAESFVREIAQVDATVAVTLARIARQPFVPSPLEMHWADIPMSPQSVEVVLAGGELAGDTPGRAVIHDLRIERFDSTSAMLVMTPNQRSANPTYQQFSMWLESPKGGQELQAVLWELR